ncbi:uncharacterized protein VP01_2721g2 [Puccinia sorghi]|uniref:SANT domain-containing protein n=1 Tax=Puccinia sorghi TaxID=27349 RepID=A0A0L6V421_9BASI|nr:uncharacterized protein VP01_2721g2 [Puccinia sorghi]
MTKSGGKRRAAAIEACQIYGLGSWSDIVDHVGNGRTNEEAKRQYHDVFIGSNDYPLPVCPHLMIDQDEFQARKNEKIGASSCSHIRSV